MYLEGILYLRREGWGSVRGVLARLIASLRSYEALCTDPTATELIHLLLQEMLTHPQSRRGALDKDGSLDAVGDEGDATHDVGDQFGSSKWISLHLLLVELNLEVDEVRLMGLQVFLQFATAVTTGKGVGVLTFGQEDDLDTEALFEE